MQINWSWVLCYLATSFVRQLWSQHILTHVILPVASAPCSYYPYRVNNITGRFCMGGKRDLNGEWALCCHINLSILGRGASFYLHLSGVFFCFCDQMWAICISFKYVAYNARGSTILQSSAELKIIKSVRNRDQHPDSAQCIVQRGLCIYLPRNKMLVLCCAYALEIGNMSINFSLCECV